MKPKYGDNMQLVLTDTDSFVFAIKTEDWFDDMSGMMQHFDTANFPKDHKQYSKDKEEMYLFFWVAFVFDVGLMCATLATNTILLEVLPRFHYEAFRAFLVVVIPRFSASVQMLICCFCSCHLYIHKKYI